MAKREIVTFKTKYGKVSFLTKRPPLPRKPDEKKIDTLEKGLSNLSEHDNLSPRLLQIEKDIDFLKNMHLSHSIFIMIIVILILVFGGMLL